MKKRFILITGLLLFSSESLWTQSFIMPNFGLKSHETLVINKIEATIKATTFSMTIENRIEGGKFCADKNIYMVYPDGTRSKLISSSGIPVCPDTHKFKTVGEKLDFTLTFPPLKQGTAWVDLIEECSDNCFYFYGITLDNSLNRKIDAAFSLAENDETTKSLISFIDIVEENDSKNLGVEGLLYVNIIRLAKGTGNSTQASDWYKKLKASGAPRLSEYIKFLNDQGIKY